MSLWSCKNRWNTSLVLTSLLFIAAGCSETDFSGNRSTSNRESAPVNATGENRTESKTLSKSSSPAELEMASSVSDTTQNPALAQPSSVPRDESQNELNTPPAGNAAQKTEPPQFEVLIKEKQFRTDRKTGALIVSYEDLDLEKVLNMKEVTENVKELMPAWLKGLSGKKIRIRGFMKPTFVAEGIERFVLARDTQACCFGPNPKIDYLVDVKMKNDTTTNYIPESRAFDVVGIFKIEPEGDGGKLFGLYAIENAEVIDR